MDIWASSFLISGGTGLIGSAISKKIIAAGGSAFVITRSAHLLNSKADTHGPLKYLDAESPIPSNISVDYVINLAGEPIAAKRWSSGQKNKLLQSRIRMTQKLASYIAETKNKPRYFFSASAVGYYGNGGEQELSETSDPRPAFSSELCQRWEGEARKVEQYCPVGIGRFAVVLSAEGGAWDEYLKPLAFKVSPSFGSGEQWFSWVHINDAVNAIGFLLQQQSNQTVNISAPEALRNKAFSQLLARRASALISPPMPAFVLKALLGQMADELLLTSQRLVPKALLEAGFKFEFPRADSCVEDLLAAKG